MVINQGERVHMKLYGTAPSISEIKNNRCIINHVNQKKQKVLKFALIISYIVIYPIKGNWGRQHGV